MICAALTASKPVAAETTTVAALGDSLVQGYGLPADQGFVPQMQSWLDGRGVDATLLNAGVSGDTTAGGLARADWTLTEDVDALIVALGGNDVLRGIDPAVSRENLEGILKTAQARNVPVLLIGISAPGNYGADYKAEFEANYPALSKRYGTLLYEDLLQPLTDLPDRTAVVERYFQPDRLHPNADGIRLIVEAVGPSVAELIKMANP